MYKDSSFEEFYFIERNDGIVQRWCGEAVFLMSLLKVSFNKFVGERDRRDVPISEAVEFMEEQVWFLWSLVQDVEDCEVLIEKYGNQGPDRNKNSNEWCDFTI